MRIWDRIKEWSSASDEDKISMDRRAFLKGMTVTSAGLIVAGPAVFDMGRSPDRHIIEPDYSGLEQRIVGELNPCGEIPISPIQVCGLQFRPGDLIEISGMSGASNYQNGIYRVSQVDHVLTSSGASSTLTVQSDRNTPPTGRVHRIW